MNVKTYQEKILIKAINKIMAKKTYECLDVPPLINFSFFSTLNIPIPPQPINYWGTFLTLTNFLKQYTYAYFLAILQQEGSVFIVLFSRFK